MHHEDTSSYSQTFLFFKLKDTKTSDDFLRSQLFTILLFFVFFLGKIEIFYYQREEKKPTQQPNNAKETKATGAQPASLAVNNNKATATGHKI